MGATASFYPATAMPDREWWEALWPRPGEAVASLGVRPGEVVVDLCCGDGLFTLPLAQIAGRVIAIDLDPALLDQARARLAASGAANCEFIAGDAYRIADLVPEPVDVVFIANTFHGVPEKARLVKAIASTLKRGGRLIIVNWHRRPREETTVLGKPRGPKTEMRMEPAEVATTVAEVGLTPVKVIELPPYHYGAIFERSDNT